MERDGERGQVRERLSALTDGELDAADCRSLVDRLLADGELRGRWERYHVARACLHGVEPPAVSRGFSARVSAAIAAEPVVHAPTGPVGQPRPAARGARPVAGLAIAASVALAAISGLVVLQQGGLQQALPGAGVVADGGPPVSQSGGETAALAGADVYAAGNGAASHRAVRKRLSMYLMSHNRFAGARDMPGVMPASRMAGFNAGQ